MNPMSLLLTSFRDMQIQFLSLFYLSTTSASDLNTPLRTPLEVSPALLFFKLLEVVFIVIRLVRNHFYKL